MTPTRQKRTETPTALSAGRVFDRILVGVDGTPQGFDACRQAGRLADRDSVLEAAAVELAPGLTTEVEREATASLQTASRILGPHAHARHLYGFVVPALLEEAKQFEATLLAVGSHGHARVEEILLGGVAGEVLHRAPCSVLVARPAPDLAAFPRRIVVGVDGSEEAELACAAARRLARRRHSSVRVLAAAGGKRVDLATIARRHRHVEVADAGAVAALVEASASADLVVVGSRGLHGLRALGSVSERVAHRAGCSVLVVRGR